ncbi:hypothetical protein DBR32_10425 [Taibaiella sp. KBW10]|nr:hypothetical protein DBR32_10425 [Taibaiella sp. KBW10]
MINSSGYTAPEAGYYLNNYSQFNSYPSDITDATILSYTYYDNYTQLSGFSFDPSKVPAPPTNDNTIVPSINSNSVKGLVTGTKLRIMDPENPNGNDWITTVNYYDAKGRMIQSQQNNLKGGTEINSNLYFFQGMAYENVNYHQNPDAKIIPGANAALTSIKLDKKYKRNLGFGGNDQVWNIQQSINDGTAYNIAYYDYNHLGQPVVKQYTIANVLQEYNIRGWLKHIQARNPVDQDINYFNETLHYDQGFGSKLYNGNIAGITWNYYNTDDNAQKHAYGYSYDQVNRLTHAEYRNNIASPNNWVKDNFDYTNSNISYDALGNIQTMNHRGNIGGSPGDMDILSYTYAPNSNKLVKVSDAVAAATTNALPDFKDNANEDEEYTYDDNGNLLSDANKDITKVVYNYLNKPELIAVGSKGKITYTYDAAGNRLRKKIKDYTNATTEIWDYIGNFVYKDDQLQYIINEEGRSRPQGVTSGSQSGQTKFVYDYFIKDHLGNVRSTISAAPDSAQYLARHEIATANAEQLVFDNIAAVREDKPGSINPDDVKAAKLIANNPNKRIGTAIMLRVMPGDKLTFATDAYYETEPNHELDNSSAEDIVTSLTAALTGGTVGGMPVSESGNSSNLINQALGNAGLGNQLENILNQTYTGNGPKAGLNYLFFDKNMKLMNQISGSLPVTATPGVFNNISHTPVVSTEPGYVIVYVDNRNIGTDVWFDNVQVSHYSGQVLEEDHYYPFGLTLAQTSAGGTPQPYKYNGKELEKSFGLETYEYGARQYDPQIARWKGVDPLANKYYGISPFVYVANNPVKYIDPDGKKIVVHHNKESYQYTPGVKPAAGSPEILMKVHEAAVYSMQTNMGKEIWNTVGNSEKVVNINFRDATVADRDVNHFQPIVNDRKNEDVNLGKLEWDYNSKVLVGDGPFVEGMMSPSTVLVHELGHVVNMINALAFGIGGKAWSKYIADTEEENFGYDAQYGTKEERENTEKHEMVYIDQINALEKAKNGSKGSHQQKRKNHDADIDYRNNTSDVNLNPSQEEQKTRFNATK